MSPHLKRRQFLGATFLLLGTRAAHAQEISATLDVARSGLPPGVDINQRISGGGHEHDVIVQRAELERLWNEGQVIVRSGPALNGRDEHSHWVRVRLT